MLVVFREVTTRLATMSIHHGAFYGLDVTPTQVASNALRALGEMFAAIYVNPEVFKLLRG